MVTKPVTTRLLVKVVPGATHPGIVGWLGDSLKVRVAAAPERGKANAAVEAEICSALSLPPGAARVVAGKTSPRKTIEIAGMSQSELRVRLNKQIA